MLFVECIANLRYFDLDFLIPYAALHQHSAPELTSVFQVFRMGYKIMKTIVRIICVVRFRSKVLKYMPQGVPSKVFFIVSFWSYLYNA